MDPLQKIFQSKIKQEYFSFKPFIEIDSCFNPCLKQTNIISDNEKQCFNNCIKKYLVNQVHQKKRAAKDEGMRKEYMSERISRLFYYRLFMKQDLGIPDDEEEEE